VPRVASAWSPRCPASAVEDRVLGLPRDQRLRQTRDIQRVQRTGTRIRLQSVLILFTPSDQEQTRVALTVSRKVGNAVTRNRVKRWLREAIRHQSALIPARRDVVVIAHPQAVEAGLESLKEQLCRGWAQLGGAA
jgi:ribonuclease P protein component